MRKYSVRKYLTDECIAFRSTKGEYGGLSNMARGFPIKISGTILRNAEVLYQAFRFPDYPEIQKTITSIASPIKAKQFGREHIMKTRGDWEEHRFKIMRFCIAIKYIQNAKKFAELLNRTENLPIVEYSAKDKVWGAIKVGDYYVGTNALGRLLMELREKTRHGNFEIEKPDVSDLKLFSKEVELEDVITVPNFG